MQDDSQALNEQVETETTSTESPAVEEQTTEAQTVVSTEPEVAPKKGAQSRIRELSGENRSLRERIQELTSPGVQTPQPVFTPTVNKPLVGADESIDGAELERRMQDREQRVLQQATNTANFIAQQAANTQRINQETVEVVSKYAELDLESDSFDEEINDAIYESVEAKLRADPTASVKDFVKRQMSLYRREASREEAKTEAVISKQAAQSAIRPTQTKPVEKNFADLSIEEMRTKLGYVE